MVHPAAGVGHAGAEVIRLQVRHLVEDLRGIESSGEEVEHVHHADSHAADTGLSAALLGIGGDAMEQAALALARRFKN